MTTSMAAVVFLLRRHVFTSYRQAVLIVPLVPLILFASHASAATPVLVAINQTTGDGWTTAASVVTIGIFLFYVWIISKAVISTAGPTPERRDVAEPSGRGHTLTATVPG